MTGRANSTGTQTLTLRQAQGRLFDVENRLYQVQGTGGGYSGTATYVYDGDGNRIKKTEGGSTVVYPNKYYEKNVTSDVVTSHYYLGGQQIAIKKGSTLEYLHQDSLNSSSLSTDDDGAQVSKTVFYPFGDCRNSTGSLGTDQLYTGQRLDGTGLYFYNARYYDAGMGRFISPDNFVQFNPNAPLSSAALAVNLAPLFGTPMVANRGIAFPQGLNRYVYSHNSPLRYSDPSGWWTFGWGLNVQFTGFGVSFSASVMVLVSGRGELGVGWSAGGGGGAGGNPKSAPASPTLNNLVGASATYQLQYTTADSITQLRGPSTYVGGSGGADGIVGGAEYMTGNTYQGVNIQAGVGTPGFEMHGMVETEGVKVLVDGSQPAQTAPSSPALDPADYPSWW